MYDRSQSIQQTENGRTFAQAWAYRDSALGAARTQTGQPDTTLGGKGVAAIKAAYIDDLNDLLLQNPNFKVLHNMMIKEWD
jgi:hypothetical protein